MCRASVQGLFDAGKLIWIAAVAGTVFCGFQRERTARTGARSSGRLRAAGLGECDAIHFAGGQRSCLEFDAARHAKYGCTIRRLPEFLNEVGLPICSLGLRVSDLRCAATAKRSRSRWVRTRGQIQVSIVLTH